jgi:hypothetical protein
MDNFDKNLNRDEFLKAALQSVVPHELNEADIKAARVMGKQYFDIIDRAKNTSTKITQIIYDIENLVVFPVFSNDNLESLLKRYIVAYPDEVAAILEKAKLQHDVNPTGFGKNLKWQCSIPQRFVQICQALDKNFWADAKHLRQFMQLCPKLSAKSKHTQINIH